MVYGLAIITVYVILVLFKQGGLIIRGLKEFYEINHLQSDYWWMVIIISLACSIGLFIIQRLRSLIVWKEWR
jgi:hypothetical protein